MQFIKPYNSRALLAALVKVYAFATLLWVLPVAGAAEPIEVVYAVGYPNDQLIKKSSLSETVIEREQLDQYGNASLAEVLSDIAGLFVDQNAGRGSFNSLFLRGADPNFTQVRINGIVVNDATNTRGGAFDLGSLSALAVERIDIISDASSALYGSQALAGVINIVTRQAKSGAEAVIGLDSHGGHASSFMLANTSLSLSLTSERPATSIKGSAYQSDHIDLNGNWLLTDRHELRLNARAQKSARQSYPDDSGGASFAINRDVELREINVAQLGLHYLYTLDSGSKIEVNTSVFSRDEQRLTPSIAPGLRDPFGFPEVRSSTDYRRTLAEVRYLGIDNTRWNWLAGLSWEREEGEQLGVLDFTVFALPSDFSLERDTISASALLTGRLSDNLKLALGGRLERINGKTIFSPRVSAEFTFSEHQELFASWGEGFKSASFYALGDPLIGNPKLNDERSKSFELGHRWASKHWQLRHTVFSSEYTDLIDFDFGPPPKLLNRSKIKNRGIESAAKFIVNTRWSINMKHSYVSTDAPSTLRQRPRYRAYLGVNYKNSEHFSVWARGSYTSKRFDSSIPTGDQYLNSYQVLNVGMQWRLRPRWALTANLQNVLKERYQLSIGNIQDDSTMLLQLKYLTDSVSH